MIALPLEVTVVGEVNAVVEVVVAAAAMMITQATRYLTAICIEFIGRKL
jgi:hypothetical protein